MVRQKRTEILVPFTVLVDTSEQLPYRFTGLKGDLKENYLPLVVATERRSLKPLGDYTLDGFKHLVAVERKSLADLYGTIATGRDRFEAELAALNQLCVAFVVVEATLEEVLSPPENFLHTQYKPKSVVRSIIAWQQRYSKVHWWFAGSRRRAEGLTFRILQRFYLDVTKNGVGGDHGSNLAGSRGRDNRAVKRRAGVSRDGRPRRRVKAKR